MSVKIAKYKGFGVYRRPYLLWPPVTIGGREQIRAKVINGEKKYIYFLKKWLPGITLAHHKKKMARGHEQAQVTRNLWVAIHLDCRAKPNKYVPDIQ